MTARLEISLFGTCVLRMVGNEPKEIRGVKHRALVAMLVCAPLGRQTRTALQTTLWGQADYDSGHQNLRRALADIRKILGADFETFFYVTKHDVEIDLDHVSVIGSPDMGEFLGDLNIHERGFVDWVRGIRENIEPVTALCKLAAPQRAGRIRPKVTALPLSVIGADPELRVLADWVAEETCRSLSRSNLLDVVSHLSSRAMAQRLIDIQQVRKTLDVDYLVTGTFRRQRDEYIADFDFVDATSGAILWNRHVSCPASSFTEELQGHLVNVIQSIGRSIAETTIDYVRGHPLEDIDDHQLIMAGVSLMHRSRMRDFLSSRDYLEEATKRMPRAADAHAWLGKWYIFNVFNGFTSDRDGDTRKALDSTARALDLDPESSFGLTIDGFANNNLLKDLDTAEKRYSAALDVNPNESLSWLLRGTLMAFQDDGTAAVRSSERARRLSPIDPFGYFYDTLSSTAYLAAEDYEKALDYAERSILINDRHISTLRARITALHFLGREAEARACAEDMMRRYPSFTLDDYRRSHPSAQHEIGKRTIEALIGAGVQ